VATDKIVAEYTVKVDQALKQLDALAGKVNKVDQATKKTEQDFKDMSSSMVSSLSKVGAAIGVAFGARELIAFGAETVKLAAQAEGVERAFKRIGGGQYLQGLRDATRGTVTDLVLMQNAVKASNFKIPLENLASLFKFAQARARETGESVDYLVDSIILGIGRKSPLILDNLGISAVALRDKLKGVGTETASVGDIAQAVGDIATEEMAKMGDQADTTADKIAQIGVAFDNFKVSLGKELISQFSELNAEISKTGQLLNLEGFDGLSIVMKGISNAVEGVLEPFKVLNSLIQGNVGAYQLLREILGLTNGVIDENIDKLHKQQKATVEVKAATETATEAQKEEIKNVAYYEKAIQDVVDAIKNEATAFNAIRPLREKEKQLRAELAALLGEETKEQKELREQLEKIAKLRLMEYTMMQSTGIPVVQAMSSSIAGLNKMLSKQRKILETSPEFSQQYKDASIAVDELEQKIKNFNDNQIDPSAGYPDISAMGVGDPTNSSGKPWFDGMSDAELAQQEQSLQQWNMYASAITDLMNNLAALNRALADEELANLEYQLQQGLITRDKYDQKRREILTQQAEDQKTFNIFNAIVNGASAVINAFNQGGPALAAIVAASVAAEVAIIAATPTPQFAKGVIDLKGKGTGTSDSIDAKLSKGESVMTAEETKKHKAMFTAIRKGGWESYKFENIITPAIDQVLAGGFEGMGASFMLQNNFNDKNLIRGLDRMRTSEKDSARFIVQELRQVLKPRKRGGYA
jgi:hypothetical protein